MIQLSKKLQAEIEKQIPKKEQARFVESALSEKLAQYKAMKSNKIEVYVDGGSRGNPGPSGGGFALYPPNGKVIHGSEFFGHKTNNQSEYLALRCALREAYMLFPDAGVECFMDSELVVKQMNGEYKVKSDNVKPLFAEVRRIADQFKHFKISHVPREQNKVADGLANEAMDGN